VEHNVTFIQERSWDWQPKLDSYRDVVGEERLCKPNVILSTVIIIIIIIIINNLNDKNRWMCNIIFMYVT